MSDPQTPIDRANVEPGEEPMPAAPEGFSVHDASTANWVVRKIIEARAYATRISNWAAVETRRAEREEQFLLHRYGPQLEAWARQQLRETGNRRRSIALPSGTIGFRSLAGHLVIVDEPALLTWCGMNLTDAVGVQVQATGVEAARLRKWAQDNCQSATVTVSVSKSVVDEHFRSTGECPEGTDCLGTEKFYVK